MRNFLSVLHLRYATTTSSMPLGTSCTAWSRISWALMAQKAWRERGCCMGEYAKGIVIALAPEDGGALWQPLPSRGYVTNKINPYNSPYDSFSTGLQVLEPGAHIRRHAHERSHELLFCYRGSGDADIAGKHYEICPETMILIGRGLQHKVTNTGTD